MNLTEAINNNKRKLNYKIYFKREDAITFLNDVYSFLFLETNITEKIICKHLSELFKNNQDDCVCTSFLEALPKLQMELFDDAAFYLKADPACKSLEEVLFTYTEFFAIYTYRLAHLLDNLGVLYLPRFLTEYAHSKTGIDINPKAKIGSPFFIDHGTGIVIGETSTIGKNVRLYQGVTLGALSLNDAESLIGVKRHPTIEDNVIIYANATILGGNTIVKKGSIIGASAFIVKSTEENSKNR